MAGNKRRVGSAWEDKACEYMKQQGFIILNRNYRCRMGEIDIIAMDGDVYVFTEVKYRSSNSFGMSYEAVTPKKQQVIRKVALFYLLTKGLSENTPVRMDVCGFDEDKITYIKGAF